jgi:hypothetical protein
VRIFTMSVHSVTIAALLSLAFLDVLFSQANPTAPEPKFTELSRDDSALLEQQRAVVAATAKQRYGTKALTGARPTSQFFKDSLREGFQEVPNLRTSMPWCNLWRCADQRTSPAMGDGYG